MRTLIAILIFGAHCCLCDSQAFAWGERGHQILSQSGARLATGGTPFWSANSAAIATLATVPDLVWKASGHFQAEDTFHWFQPDSYYASPNQFGLIPHIFSVLSSQFGEASVVAHGTAPWRVQELYNLAVVAFRQGRAQLGLQYAGTLSHYVGDLSQPLHVTQDFDGQLTGDKGIHHFFETDNIEAANIPVLTANVMAQARALLANPQFQAQFGGTLVDVTFAELLRAYAYKDQIIQTDLKLGRTGLGATTQLTLAQARLADGAATYAMILTRLWREAGSPALGSALAVPTPAWIPADFLPKSAATAYATPGKSAVALADDCLDR